MRYVEAKVEILHLDSLDQPYQPEDAPDLVGDPKSISNLYKLLDLEAFTIFKGIRIILENPLDGEIGLFPLSGVLQIEEGYRFTHFSENEYIVGMILPNLNKGFLHGNLFGVQNYIECKGFIPVAE